MKLSRLFVATVLVAGLSTTASAQVDISTGTGNGWQVMCNAIGSATNAGPCDGSTFFDAVQVTPGAGDWPTGPWIGAVSNGILGQQNGENPSWEMTFRKYVNFAGVQPTDVAVLSVSRMVLDNYFLGASLNGTAFVPNWDAPTGAPVPPNGSNWTKEFSFTNNIAGGLVEGQNMLEFKITGNGQTDMLAVTGTLGLVQGETVPEPASLALLTLGLAGFGVAARRRRSV